MKTSHKILLLGGAAAAAYYFWPKKASGLAAAASTAPENVYNPIAQGAAAAYNETAGGDSAGGPVVKLTPIDLNATGFGSLGQAGAGGDLPSVTSTPLGQGTEGVGPNAIDYQAGTASYR